MENIGLLIVLLAVLSIIPAMIAAVVLWLRNEAIKGDVTICNLRTENSSRDVNHLIGEYQSLMQKISDAELKTHEVNLKLVALEESFQNLNNKWVSRERADRLAQKREEKQAKEEEMVETEEIPGTEQIGLFDQLQPADEVQEVPRRRKFGVMP